MLTQNASRRLVDGVSVATGNTPNTLKTGFNKKYIYIITEKYRAYIIEINVNKSVFYDSGIGDDFHSYINTKFIY